MATIRVRKWKDGSTTVQAQIRMSGQRPLSKSFGTRVEAKAWVRETEAKLAKGDLSASESEHRTLGEACDKYLETHPDTAKDRTRVVKKWRDQHGRRALAKVTTPWLTQIRDELAAGSYTPGGAKSTSTVRKRRKPATVNLEITYLRIVLSYAVQIGWMPMVPKVKKFKADERVRYLDDKELADLTAALEKCHEPVMLPFVFCAMSSGARAGELLKLDWKNVDLAKGLAVIHTSKNGAGRQLYFAGRALTYLKAYAKVRRLDTKAVFVLKSGKRLTHSKYGKLFRAAVDAAEITDFRFHDTRHCCASMIAMNGGSLLEVQHALGHKTPTMTARYAHLTQSHVENVVRRVMSEKLA